MAVGDAYVFPGFLTPVLTLLFFPKPPTTFLTCFCRGERRKYAGKKSRLNRESNSQPPGHESDTFTTEPPGRGVNGWWFRTKVTTLKTKVSFKSMIYAHVIYRFGLLQRLTSVVKSQMTAVKSQNTSQTESCIENMYIVLPYIKNI